MAIRVDFALRGLTFVGMRRHAGAAEKRDWAWVDALELIERLVDGGSCRVRARDGQRLILLPRLGVTLRSYLRYLLMCIESRTPSADILVVPLQTASRCLHVFGVQASFSEVQAKEAFEMVSAACLRSNTLRWYDIFLIPCKCK
jgi:hypothetical protein